MQEDSRNGSGGEVRPEEHQKAIDAVERDAAGEPRPAGERPAGNHGIDVPEELPIVGLDNFVLFPFMIAPMIVGREQTKRLVDDVLRGDRMVGVFLRRDSDGPEDFENVHGVGTLAVVLKMLRMPDDTVRLLLHGVARIEIEETVSEDPYLRARVREKTDYNKDSRLVPGLVRNVQRTLNRIVGLGQLPEDLSAAIDEMKDPGKLADLAVSQLNISIEERQDMLGMTDVEERLTKALEILTREVELAEIGSEIQSKVKSRIDESQREYMLREQMKTIQSELGEEEGQNPDIAEIVDRIEEADLPENIQEVADREIKRLQRIHPSSPEYSVARSYLDWIAALPWNKTTEDQVDVERAQRILDEDHYDLNDVKERILEHLSVMKLRKEIRGPILCFVGPPGVGKTSLGQSIARSLGRAFYRVSLGGMHDEAEIRGHRRTYIGAMPGKIIKGVRDSKSKNPLIMLDEIDKVGADFRGDPASALLEVLDPAQNSTFTDHYLDMPFDLSKVMFITTANVLDPIPSALLDRMEVLKLSGYTSQQKLEIAKRYLVPRSRENAGLNEEQVVFTDDGLLALVEGYTREAGVRNLEREIGRLCRKVARTVAEGQDARREIDPAAVEELLGPRSFYRETADRMGSPGVAIGLAWTQYGGEILFIEANSVSGSGKLTLTGQLGDVMKESAMAALSFIHANARSLQIPEDRFSKYDIHLHIPAGATPKDGPSAGIAMAAALCSLLMDRNVKERLAMTGEITLKGNVLPVGGVKEKVIAAHRAGVREIILPKRNRKDLEKDVPEEVRQEVQFHFVEHVSSVLRIAILGRVDIAEPRDARVETATLGAPSRREEPAARPANRESAAPPSREPEPRREAEPSETRPESPPHAQRAADESDGPVLRIEPDPDYKPASASASASTTARKRRRRGGRGRGRRSGEEQREDERGEETAAAPEEAGQPEAKREEEPRREPVSAAKRGETAAAERTGSKPEEIQAEQQPQENQEASKRRTRRGGRGRSRRPRSEEAAETQAGSAAPEKAEQMKPEVAEKKTPSVERTRAVPVPSEKPAAEAETRETPATSPETGKAEKKPAKKTTKKTAARKTAAKKTTKKTAAKKTAAKKTAKKTAAKKTAAKKTAKKTSKTAAKKTAAKKTTSKKTTKKTTGKTGDKKPEGGDGEA